MTEMLGVPGEKITLSPTAYEQARMRNESRDPNREWAKRKEQEEAK